MKGSREEKLYISRFRDQLRRVCFDDLAVFKFERCKKWRKQHRAPRDGSNGTSAGYVEKD